MDCVYDVCCGIQGLGGGEGGVGPMSGERTPLGRIVRCFVLQWGKKKKESNISHLLSAPASFGRMEGSGSVWVYFGAGKETPVDNTCAMIQSPLILCGKSIFVLRKITVFFFPFVQKWFVNDSIFFSIKPLSKVP